MESVVFVLRVLRALYVCPDNNALQGFVGNLCPVLSKYLSTMRLSSELAFPYVLQLNDATFHLFKVHHVG